MDREPVSSTNVASIGYCNDTQTLEVEFLNGRIYQYFDVPYGLHQELMASDSKGKYLHRNVYGQFSETQL